MNSKILHIALQITLLKEQFLEEEILEAITLLEQNKSSSELLVYLSGNKEKVVVKTLEDKNRKKKSIGEQKSKAVIDLEQKDPAKYRVLSNFDNLVRKGVLLPQIDDLRKLGEKLNKDFVPPKSRREAISKIMNLLASFPTKKIKTIVDELNISEALEDKSNEYQELANFIIKGKEN